MNQESIKKANWLFAQECKFIVGANKLDIIPEMHQPEIAFIGRSNVGKSSLINALTGQNSLARVSNTPGRTKQLNFFSLLDVTLVDLPGYGYAKASKSEIANFSKLILGYLKGSPNLVRVCLLIDSRHGVKSSDQEFMRLLDDIAVNYQIILTKSDKCSKSELTQHLDFIQKIATLHPAIHPEVIITSSKDKDGIETLRMAIAAYSNSQK